MVIGVLMVVFACIFYDVWLQENFDPLSLRGGLLFPYPLLLLPTGSTCFNIVINGTGKIWLQMVTLAGAAVMNIPVSIFCHLYLNLGTTASCWARSSA